MRAGFTVEPIDEDDRASRHGEFIATHKGCDARYWIEAKRRHRQVKPQGVGTKDKADVQGLIAKALGKPTDLPRIIFVDVNLPPWTGSVIQAPWVSGFEKSLTLLAMQPHFRGDPSARAYVIATNHPYHYVSKTRPDPRQHFLGTWFNMPGMSFSKLIETHPPIIDLMQSIANHFAIPAEFAPP